MGLTEKPKNSECPSAFGVVFNSLRPRVLFYVVVLLGTFPIYLFTVIFIQTGCSFKLVGFLMIFVFMFVIGIGYDYLKDIYSENLNLNIYLQKNSWTSCDGEGVTSGRKSNILLLILLVLFRLGR